jgi:regulator of RNase E activity RraA
MPRVEVSEAVLNKLRKVSTTTISGALSQLGVVNTFMEGVVPRTSLQHFAGTAFTLHTLPTRADVVKAAADRPNPHRSSFATVGKNNVVVIDARGELGTGVLGDVFAASIKARGGVALVTDGCTRDLPAMEEVGLPVYTRGAHANGFGTKHIGADLNIPIQCAGVLVIPGDVLVGDEQGVIVIPQALAEEVANRGYETDMRDNFSRMKVLGGAPLSDAFPLSDKLRPEYEEWRKQQPNE